MTDYPVTWPLPTRIRTRRITIDPNEAVFEGQFSRIEQVQQHGAGKSDRWVGLWTTTTLEASEVAVGEGMLWSLKGRFGTFRAYDPDRRMTASADISSVLWAGSTSEFAGATTTFAGNGVAPFPGVVDGGDQLGTTLAATFDQASTLIGSIGDYFQLGLGYHSLTAPATTDGSGDVNLEFEPAMRISPSNGQSIYMVNPTFIARLDEPYVGGDTGVALEGVISFSFHEVI